MLQNVTLCCSYVTAEHIARRWPTADQHSHILHPHYVIIYCLYTVFSDKFDNGCLFDIHSV